MRKMFLRQFVVIFLMFTFVLLPLSSQAGSGAYEREDYVLDSSTPSKTFPMMRPSVHFLILLLMMKIAH